MCEIKLKDNIFITGFKTYTDVYEGCFKHKAQNVILWGRMFDLTEEIASNIYVKYIDNNICSAKKYFKSACREKYYIIYKSE